MAGNPRDFVDVPLERYDSTESEGSEEFDRVPTTVEYILRIDEGGKRRQLVTKLKEGRELPYSKNVGGENIWLPQVVSFKCYNNFLLFQDTILYSTEI